MLRAKVFLVLLSTAFLALLAGAWNIATPSGEPARSIERDDSAPAQVGLLFHFVEAPAGTLPPFFLTRGPNYTARFAADRVLFRFHGGAEKRAEALEDFDEKSLELLFVDCNGRAEAAPLGKTQARTNFIKGSPQTWKSGLPSYREIVYRELWPGVDLIFHGEKELKYRFHVRPGARLDAVRLAYRGARSVELSPNGDLHIETGAVQMTDSRPSSWQNIDGRKVPVAARFELHGSRPGYAEFGIEAVQDFDPTAELIVDPGLQFSSFLGGAGSEPITEGGARMGLATDGRGAVYIAGSTNSFDFLPADRGGATLGDEDVFVAKLDAAGRLLYTTFIGGSGNDRAAALAVDAKGRLYVFGDTDSADFPTLGGSFSPAPSGDRDAFLLQLDERGETLIASTLLGGARRDLAGDLALDAEGNVVVAGATESADFPVTAAAHDGRFGGGQDAFLAKLTGDASNLIFSTFLGGDGPGDDRANALALDEDGSVVVVGETASPDFPVTPHSSDPSFHGGVDAFAAKFNGDGSELIFSGLLGGGGDDIGSDAALTQEGQILLVGSTSSHDYPTTPAALSSSLGGGWDAFVTRLSSHDFQIQHSTLLGGSGDESWPVSIALDRRGNLHLAGATTSADFPVTPGSLSLADSGAAPNAFYTLLSSAGSLIHSTRLGGEGADRALRVALDLRGAVWLAGATRSADFPQTSSFQPIHGGGESDAFICRLEDPIAGVLLLGRRQVHLKKETQIDSGDVVVNQPDGLLTIEKDVRIASGFHVKADRIDVKKGAQIEAALFFNQLNLKSEAAGELISPLPLPVFAQLPRFESGSDAGPDVTAAGGDPILLPPGPYGKVELKRSASLRLSGGVYDMRSLQARRGAQILFSGPSRIRVAERVGLDGETFVGPLPDSGLEASDIVFFVGGNRGTAVELGEASRVAANFYAPEGRLRIKSEAVAEGAFLSAEIEVEPGVRLALNSAFAEIDDLDNHPPVAADDQVSGVEDSPITFDALQNDVDEDGDALFILQFSQPASGSASLENDGRFTYSPDLDFNGVDSFVYIVGDGRGGTDSAAVRIEVDPVNDPPLARDDEAVTDEDAPVTIAALDNDDDVDGDALQIVSVSQPANGAVVDNENGVLTYIPATDFNGSDSFAYTVADPEGATGQAMVRVDVAPVNDAPSAEDDAAATNEDTRVILPVLTNDFDPDGDPLQVVGFSQPAHGAVSDNLDGTLVYQPEPDFNGDDGFAYTVSDPFGAGSSAVVRLTVLPVNDPPQAADDALELAEDSSASIDVLANDSDPEDNPLTLSGFTQGAFGRVSAAGDGLLSYRPDPDFNGSDSFQYTIEDSQGATDTGLVAVLVTPVNDPPAVSLVANPLSGSSPLQVQFDATVDDPDSAELSFFWDFGDGSTASDSARQDHVYVGEGEFTAAVTVSDGLLSAEASVTVTVNSSLPPDPSQVAPPLNRSVASTVDAVAEFLHAGPNPIQRGVAGGVIDRKRAALVRGRVVNRAGEPLPGVEVTALRHPEYGSTLTRLDGMYDMVVNGGGAVVLEFRKAGFLSAQRTARVGWQEYRVLQDLALTAPDSQATTIDLQSEAPIQTARGNQVSDRDGVRQATLLFPAGLSAEMVMPDGGAVPLSRLTVRATEFTVGEDGPLAMPAELPPASFYTYAVALTVDEAQAAGAVDVRFDAPVPLYVDNFLDFPVGTEVPLGNYDPRRAEWLAADNGRVIQILNVADGRAELDVDGSGLPASDSQLQELGVSEAEQTALAALYSPGQSLWRASIPHFSIWDLNMGWTPPFDAVFPEVLDFFRDLFQTIYETCTALGSVIGCENQTLGESATVTGTPFSLNYRSDRTAGYTAPRRIEIPLSDDELPASLDSIELEVSIGGRVFRDSFPPQPNQSTVFTWDGFDAYGRRLQGEQKATVRVGYTYQGRYLETERFADPGGKIVVTPTRSGVVFWQEQQVALGPSWDAQPQGLGGWTLSPNHVYDPLGEILYRGDGSRRAARTLRPVIDTAISSGASTFSGNPDALTVGPDESIYVASGIGHHVVVLRPDGAVEVAAGTGSPFGDLGDGGPAADARLLSPRGLALGDDGSLFIADTADHRIRKVSPNGIITTFAGTGVGGFSGDGGPAAEAQLFEPLGLALGPDGTLYIADLNNRRIRRIGPDGVIQTLAGNGEFGNSGDGGPAVEALLSGPSDVAVGPDGSVFVVDTQAEVVRRVTPDGIIRRAAGNGLFGPFEDAVPAIETRLFLPRGIAAAPDGSLLISSNSQDRVRMVRPDGIIVTLAGNGQRANSGDGGPAAQAGLFSPGPLSLAPSGSCYVGVSGSVRRIFSPFPGFTANDLFVASRDGFELYRFDSLGRHLQTLHSLTGATLLTFSYDSDGQLAAVVDGDGNTTAIERNADGSPTAIRAPFGQRTALTLDADGRLATVSNPAGETFEMAYSQDGLLRTFTDPRGNASQFQYDLLGLLLHDTDQAGETQNFTRDDLEDGYRVARQTSLGRETLYRVESLIGGQQLRSVTFSDGVTTQAVADVDESFALNLADGWVVESENGPDPRFGMQSPLARGRTLATPGGLTAVASVQVDGALTDPGDPFSFPALTETFTVNGRSFTATYDATTRTLTDTSPAGRVQSTAIDSQGRPLRMSVAGMAPIDFSYDQFGRWVGSVRGTGAEQRTWTLSYTPEGYVSEVVDPLGQSLRIEYDGAGRVTRKTLADGGAVEFSYDANGNLAAATPPGRPPHRFEHSAVNQQTRYAPPGSDDSAGETRYIYSPDRELLQVIRPDGDFVEFSYDESGRPIALTTARGVLQADYDATGNLAAVIAPDGGQLAFAYDGSLPTGEFWSGRISGSVTQERDNNFRLASETVNGSLTVAYRYDDDDLLTGAGQLSLSRNPENGLLTGSLLGEISDSWVYNQFGEPVGYSASFQGEGFFSVDYVRDKLGRIVSKTETIAGVAARFDYAYDARGRLTEVRRDGTTTSTYSYDENSNRVSAERPQGSIEAVYDERDQLLSYGDVSFTYTENGDLRSRTENGQTTVYSYDALGNLINVAASDGRRIEYIVDGRNRRIGKTIDGQLVQAFLYRDQLNPVAQLDGDGHVVSRFVYASRSHVPDYLIRDGRTCRILSDQLGSPRLVVDAVSGEILQRIDYDEFGRVTLDSNPGFQPFGFAGGLHDRDTGLVRFGVRDYSPETGRWTTPDPIGFLGRDPNLYSYAGADPVNSYDQDGQVAEVVLAGAIIGAATNVGFAFFADPANFDAQTFLSAAVNGAISGAISALAGPLGGTLAKFLGASTTGLLSRFANIALSAFGGFLGQAVGNQLDYDRRSSVCLATATSGAGGLASTFFNAPTLQSLRQARYFAPSFRSIARLGGPASRSFVTSAALSSAIGSTSNLFPVVIGP